MADADSGWISNHAACCCGCGRESPVGENGIAHHGRKAHRWTEADRGYESACHIWLLAKTYNGYGVERSVDRSKRLAHRLAYERAHGPIPWRLQVDHLCRVRECVNADHLELVSPAENVRRGKGSKLTHSDVRQIRLSDEKQHEIAERFQISQGHVSRIRSFKVWVDLA